METGPGPTPLIITLPQVMVCKVQLIDTSDIFLDGWQFIYGSDALLGVDGGNSNTKLRKAN